MTTISFQVNGHTFKGSKSVIFIYASFLIGAFSCKIANYGATFRTLQLSPLEKKMSKKHGVSIHLNVRVVYWILTCKL